jgi:hypothetical protein
MSRHASRSTSWRARANTTTTTATSCSAARNSFTIHGSLDSQDSERARSSITCHAIPQSSDFLQLQSRVLKLKVDDIGGTEIFRPKDLASAKNRAVLFVESRFPSLFYWLKKRAIVYLMRRKATFQQPTGADHKSLTTIG